MRRGWSVLVEGHVAVMVPWNGVPTCGACVVQV